MTIYFILTEMCNLACSHCIRGSRNNAGMNIEKAKVGLQLLSKRFPEATLVLSGGEPTVYEYFTDIFIYAASIYNLVVINSNGTTSYFMDNMNKLPRDKICIQFSLDGTREYHDAIRGKGAFDKTISNIEFLNSLGVHVWISTVASKDNLTAIPEMPAVLSDFKIGKWQVSPMMPFGNASFDKMLSVGEWNSLVDILIKTTPFRLGVRKLFDMDIMNSLSEQRIAEISHNPRNVNFRNCGCVNSKLYIYPDMSVYGCTCLKDMCLGNLIEDGLDKIIGGEQAQKIVNYKPLSDKCLTCKFLPICNGGCYGMQHRYGCDIRCPLLGKKNL